MHAWMEFKQTRNPKYPYTDGKEVHIEIHACFSVSDECSVQFKGWVYCLSRQFPNDREVSDSYRVFSPNRKSAFIFKSLQAAKDFMEMNL